MQISNAASSPALMPTAVSGSAASDPGTVATPGTATPTTSATSNPSATTSVASSPSQDSAVTISPEGAAVAAQDAASSSSADGADTATASTTSATDGTTSTSDTSATADDSGGGASVSPLKSLAYGTLGLERPDQTQENRNPFYTAGRWIAAGLTIGGIISLLV